LQGRPDTAPIPHEFVLQICSESLLNYFRQSADRCQVTITTGT
jgi:hypothetical protein